MQKELQKLDIKTKEIKEELKYLPEGKLICAKNGKNYKWYLSDGKTKKYIPKNNYKLANQLAIKKYLLMLLKELEKEKYAIQLYLKHSTGPIRNSDAILTNHSEYKNLLGSYFKPISQELYEWNNSDYERNLKYPEQLIHKSSSGNMLRSKSEAIIDTFLFINKIPYRYEAQLQLDETTLYPDFTIRHPKTGDYFYWEHFGLMDNPTYIKNTYSKLQLYSTYEIIPTINLITTYETKNNPLSIDAIEKIISSYFL